MKKTIDGFVRKPIESDGSSQRLPLQGGSRERLFRRIAMSLSLALLILFWFAALPLPGPLGRAREKWWKASEERSGRVTSYERDGWPDDPYQHGKNTIVLQQASGDLKVRAEECESGQHHMFYGVTITDSAQPNAKVRIALPEDGTSHLAVAQQGQEDLVFPKQSCSTWDIAVTEDHTVYNSIRGLQGHASFVCRTPAAVIKGQITFKRCI